ncbi:pentatricopeptide repeat-containing protein At1g09900-like [Cryptomeria japonica]|uniref:pentatricopeptide repeat-containing protein At1g09900-like n=1 Tax=Cryptomeria japonica TaxID=3369 RepID=UPI0027DA7135|nr:pentatricopeptide repeat-containing protein At1g09900-like [Cryptomeria japonica]
MLQKLLSVKRYEEEENMLNEMTAKDFRCKEPRVFNSLIRSFSEASMMEAVFKVYDRIHDFCEPNVDTFNALLNALVQNNSFEIAISFFNKLVCAKVPVSVTTFNIAMNALCKAHRVEDVVELLRQMPEQRYLPDTYTYNTPIRGFCDKGNTDEAVELLVEMTIVTYTLLIWGMAKEGYIDQAVEILRQMPDRGCSPNVFSYCSLMAGSYKYGRFSDV